MSEQLSPKSVPPLVLCIVGLLGSSVAAQEKPRVIKLHSGLIDTTREAALPARAGEYGYYLLQFSGPAQDAWLQQLEDLSIVKTSYVPNDAFLVWVPEKSAGSIEGLQAKLGELQWISALRPAWKIDPRLDEPESSSADHVVVNVQLYPADGADASVETVRALADEVLADARKKLGVIQLRLLISPESLQRLAEVPHVLWIEKWVEPRLFDRPGLSPGG